MRRSLAKFSESEVSNHTPSLADFTTTTPELKFSVHTGYVAGVINPPARNKRSHWLNDELESDPEDWFDAAEEKLGSWWPDWDAWMRRHSDGTIPAPERQGNAQYIPIEPAPGRYVKHKSN
jgi:polyhydroxyalkanoate synthase